MSLSGPFLFDPRAFWGDEDVKLLSWAQVGVYLAAVLDGLHNRCIMAV